MKRSSLWEMKERRKGMRRVVRDNWWRMIDWESGGFFVVVAGDGVGFVEGRRIMPW